MLAYSWKLEVSRILHNSFTITWGILGVMFLVLLLITEYLSILKELYITIIQNTRVVDSFKYLEPVIFYTIGTSMKSLSKKSQDNQNKIHVGFVG